MTWLVISSSGWLYVFTQLWHTVHTDKHLLDACVAADTCVDVSCGGGGPTLKGGLPFLPFSRLSWKFGRPKGDFLFSFCLGNTLKKITKQKSGSLLPCRYCKHHEAWGEPQESESQIMCLGSHGRVEDRQEDRTFCTAWQQAESSTDFCHFFPLHPLLISTVVWLTLSSWFWLLFGLFCLILPRAIGSTELYLVQLLIHGESLINWWKL